MLPLRRGIGEGLQGGVQRRGALINFFPEHIRCLADDVTLVQIHLALVVQGEVCAGLRGDLDGLCLGFADGLEVLQNVQHLLRRAEHVGNVLEQEVALETHPHHFLGLDLPGDAEDFFSIQRYHLSFLVLTNDREEVEQILDVRLALLGVALAAGSVLRKVVGELLVDQQGAGGVKIEHIGVLFAAEGAVFVEKTGVLGTERRLHIQRRAFQVGEHQHRRPLRDSHTGGQLPHRQGDGLFMVSDGGFYPVKALLVLVRVVQLAVTGGKDHLIVPEYRVRLQLFRQRSGTVHPVQ